MRRAGGDTSASRLVRGDCGAAMLGGALGGGAAALGVLLVALALARRRWARLPAERRMRTLEFWCPQCVEQPPPPAEAAPKTEKQMRRW